MKNTYIENLFKKMKDHQEVTEGERALARAYEDSIINKGFELIAYDDILWENTVQSFVEALRAAEVREIYFTSQASNMLESYLMLDEMGLKLKGMVRLESTRYKQEMAQYGYSLSQPTLPAMKFCFEEA